MDIVSVRVLEDQSVEKGEVGWLSGGLGLEICLRSTEQLLVLFEDRLGLLPDVFSHDSAVCLSGLGQEQLVISLENSVENSLEKMASEFLDGEFIFLLKVDV